MTSPTPDYGRSVDEIIADEHEKLRLEVHTLEADRDRLRALCEELRVDAERYRTLREHSLAFRDWKVSRTVLIDGKPERQWMHGETLDEALDATSAALAKAEKEKT